MNDPRRRQTVPWTYLGAALTAFALLLGVAIPAWAAENMRVTFVRHGESAGNASGLIDTSTPGPVLTELGQQQARDVVDTLGDNNYDAIYASTMVRTQLTAAPMSQYLGLPIQVLPGLQEIEAGVFEGTPESEAANGYARIPLAWALAGNRDVVMPGTSLDGHAFDARVDGALKTMYDKGDRNVVVFSHGGTIMFWTMMNAQNLTTTQKIQLLSTAPLGNTDYVIIEGNPEDGWTLVEWNGQRFAPEPTFEHEVQLQMRTLTRQLNAAAQQVTDAIATGDVTAVATAINRSVATAAFSVTKFTRAINAEVIERVGNAVEEQPSELTNTVEANTTAVGNVVADVTSAVDMVKPLKAPVADTVTKASPTGPANDVVSNGATDLTDGNMAEPGKVGTTATRTQQRVRETVKAVSDQVAESVDKIGDAVKKAADTARDAAKATTSNSGEADSDSES
ncbi:histidine phosphatase family protein [Mycobacterium hubeiense]|uniref:histidine phosphatase family protein n=1 Tax=Mycobacterium hubeiense TaxID=1867256 RepID=UPI001E5152F3|nr:histidine phosphatase family protein [Mycobacterium sp. QGD 101]